MKKIEFVKLTSAHSTSEKLWKALTTKLRAEADGLSAADVTVRVK